jgi:hypothetical protein
VIWVRVKRLSAIILFDTRLLSSFCAWPSHVRFPLSMISDRTDLNLWKARNQILESFVNIIAWTGIAT